MNRDCFVGAARLFAMTGIMDSRFRGNDSPNYGGNDKYKKILYISLYVLYNMIPKLFENHQLGAGRELAPSSPPFIRNTV